MHAYCVIGVDGEVFAVLVDKDNHLDLDREYKTFQNKMENLRQNPDNPLTREQALIVLARADHSDAIDPDAESFVSYLTHEHGMELVPHETFTFSN